MRCTPRLASLLLLALACTPAWAQNTREAKSDAPGPAIDLPLPWKVGGVLRYATDGTFVDEFVPSGTPGLVNAAGMAFGADGNLYVVSAGTASVLR